MQKSFKTMKVFVIFALLTTILGCRALSESLDPGDVPKENLREVKREKPNLSAESAKIDVDPDSDALTADTPPATNPVKNDSTNALPTNSNSNANNANANTNQNVETSTDETVVTHNSFGKIKVGMTVSQASQASAIELVPPTGNKECHYVEPKQGFKGISFMVIDGVIARIDVKSKTYTTDKGAKIGDTEDKIKSLYKGVSVYPQKYDAKKNDMEVYSEDEKYLIIFETDGKVVTGFRVGRIEEVGWVEGCG